MQSVRTRRMEPYEGEANAFDDRKGPHYMVIWFATSGVGRAQRARQLVHTRDQANSRRSIRRAAMGHAFRFLWCRLTPPSRCNGGQNTLLWSVERPTNFVGEDACPINRAFLSFQTGDSNRIRLQWVEPPPFMGRTMPVLEFRLVSLSRADTEFSFRFFFVLDYV